MKKLFLLVCALMLIGLLLLVAACAGGSASQQAPTHILTPTAPPLGMVPQDCLPGPTPKKVTAQFGPLIGGSPIWAAGFAGPHATIPLSPQDPYTPYGWTVKILWGIEPGYTHAVTLHGENLRTGARLYFNVTGQPTPAPVLDPEAVGTPINQWKDFPSHLFIPTAGCYALEATWPGGQWRITFAAGQEPGQGAP
jgi:hypothetical protein